MSYRPLAMVPQADNMEDNIRPPSENLYGQAMEMELPAVSARVTRWCQDFKPFSVSSIQPSKTDHDWWLQLYVDKLPEFEKLLKCIKTATWWDCPLERAEIATLNIMLDKWARDVFGYESIRGGKVRTLMSAHLTLSLADTSTTTKIIKKLKEAIIFISRVENSVKNDPRKPRYDSETLVLVSEISKTCHETTAYTHRESNTPIPWEFRR